MADGRLPGCRAWSSSDAARPTSLSARCGVRFWEPNGSDHPRFSALRCGQRDRLQSSEQGRYLLLAYLYRC
jgi:hypothetical protein